MIDKATIDRIFAAADIVEVISDFITLKRKGASYTACCPFHSEKTPSFVVSPAKGLYKCFGCGKGGGAINFVMEHEKLTYPEALRFVARKYGIEIEERKLTDVEQQLSNDRESMLIVNSWADTFFVDQLHNTDVGRNIGLAYFQERGFTADTIAKFSLGYCPEVGARDAMSRQGIASGYQERYLVATGLTIIHEDHHSYYDRFAGRVIFPIHSLTGRILGFGGRTMRTDKKTAKYLNSPQSEIYDKSHTLYGIFQAKKAITTLDKCILVEGYTDVMQMHQSGIQNVVASSGTSLTEQQVKLIKRFTTNVTVIYDGDMAGIKASMRGIDMILREGLTVRVVPLPTGDDPDSFARQRSASELESYIAHNEEDFLSFKARILLDGVENDPSQRAALINEIVRSIAVIPDAIAREVYIRQCAMSMDISVDVLNRSVVAAIIAAPSPASQRIARQTPEDATPVVVVNQPVPQTRSIELLERELVGYLIKYGNETFKFELSPDNIVELPVAKTIVDEIRNDQIQLTVPTYSIILNAYAMALDKGYTLSMAELLDNEDREVSATAADIVARSEQYDASAMWERYDMRPKSEREQLNEAVPKTIVIYKTKIIEAQVAVLREELSHSIDEIDIAKIEQIQRLNAAKQAMHERYRRMM